MSGGRLEFGVGRGYQPMEFQALGIDLIESRTRMDESVEIILQAWKGEPFSHEGRHFRFPTISVHPRPLQRPRMPLLVASAGGYVPGAADTFTWGAERNCRIVIGGFRASDQLREDRVAQRRIALEDGTRQRQWMT
jgi:alkanesulfonate monooxygenase SsuD/methylene tetrahydromethanopterin reductase-like flavin-dependent oxidoreductase (luciferase family)